MEIISDNGYSIQNGISAVLTAEGAAMTSSGSNLNLEEKEEESAMKIAMPQKIIKTGWPKGAEVTVVGLISQKKPNLGTKKGITCFSKLKPFEKDICFGMFCETIGCMQCSQWFSIGWSNWYNNKCQENFRQYLRWSGHQY